MGIPKNYFKDMFSDMKINQKGQGYSLDLDLSKIGIRLDIAQDALDKQVLQDVMNYMPVDTGMLKSNTAAANAFTRGEVYMYPPGSDYGRYQYEGIKFVDSETGKGAFYAEGFGYWSRPGVKKVSSGQPLNYSQPNAQAHWGEVAMENHKESWINVVKRALSW